MRLVDKKSKLVAIVGRPNVGKSSLFNRIIGYNKAIVCDWEGTTRDRVVAKTGWQNMDFWLVDTAGILREFGEGSVEQSAMKQVKYSIDEADLILFVVDAKNGLCHEDKRLWRQLLSSKSEVMLLVNKVDSPKVEEGMGQFYELGADVIWGVSAINGRGVGDMLDEVVKKISLNADVVGQDVDLLKVCILGRPNVGKSTLTNALCGFDRMAVGPVAGTTRDVGEIKIRSGSDYFWLIDTAGMLSPGRYKKKDINRFSYVRALMEARRSDLAVIVIDGAEGITRMDLAIMSLARDLGLGIILFVNKWDLVSEPEKMQEKYIRQLQKKAGFIYWVPVIFGSAIESINTKVLLKKLKEVGHHYQFRANKQELSDFVTAVGQTNFQISRLGINKIKQVSSSPPKFEIFVRHRKSLSCNNERLMERLIRDYFGLAGVGIKLIWK